MVKSFWNQIGKRKKIYGWKCLFSSKKKTRTRYPNQDYQTEEVRLYSQRYEDRVHQSQLIKLLPIMVKSEICGQGYNSYIYNNGDKFK